ncbi:haloalkane dehalogenase [Mongoliibacter ruber]|uniref:Haloalkane dehalogenase n=2 Tax=Mongoliibacter ruber TaxID=1750599 RepID=A0A2T0WDJ6_9BACT|nr:haloalkane dehalogenase [Mongoliibacter ruber]
MAKTLLILLSLSIYYPMAQAQNSWLDREKYPFTSNYFSVNSQKMHYINEGTGELILFVHGTPSWSFDWRKIIKDLRTDYQCVAIDHIGFGLSDKPKSYDYSTFNHSMSLEKFILEKGYKDITLVLHDFGGPIGFHFALRHPDLVKNIIVLNSWLWSSEGDQEYEKFVKILRSPILPFIYKYLNFSPRFILPKSYGDHKPDKKTLKHYIKPFTRASERNGPLAFAKSLLNDQDWFESLWQQRQLLKGKPVGFIWGMNDPIISPKNLEKFKFGFPRSSVFHLEDSGHFPQEEEPVKVIAAIRRLINK